MCVCVWDEGLQGDLIFCKRAFLCRCRRRRRLALRFLFFSPRDGGDEMTNGPFFAVVVLGFCHWWWPTCLNCCGATANHKTVAHKPYFQNTTTSSEVAKAS